MCMYIKHTHIDYKFMYLSIFLYAYAWRTRNRQKKTLQTTFLLIILFESFECRVASLITKRLARRERIYIVCVCVGECDVYVICMDRAGSI